MSARLSPSMSPALTTEEPKFAVEPVMVIDGVAPGRVVEVRGRDHHLGDANVVAGNGTSAGRRGSGPIELHGYLSPIHDRRGQGRGNDHPARSCHRAAHRAADATTAGARHR